MSDSEKKEVYYQENDDIPNDEKMLKSQMIREFYIVAHAVAEIGGTYLCEDFGLAQIASGEEFPVIDSSSKQKRMNRKWAKLIDLTFYLTSYCLMSRKNLTTINIWL